jgi:hypothetical protein
MTVHPRLPFCPPPILVMENENFLLKVRALTPDKSATVLLPEPAVEGWKGWQRATLACVSGADIPPWQRLTARRDAATSWNSHFHLSRTNTIADWPRISTATRWQGFQENMDRLEEEGAVKSDLTE